MPVLKVLATIAACDFCDARASHVATLASPIAVEVFERGGWLITEALTACRRCAPLARLALDERTTSCQAVGA
ncbi:MAG: hypothetical protein KF861_00365 [Planctomycetaceae bacterium]|nr:hypothetical protein [Planctomycetaceae bacterium]